ncbi:hypothetical protein [Streptomyces cyaneofuscatus]
MPTARQVIGRTTSPAPVIGLVTGLVTGLAAGLHPAWRASRIEPAEALRR